MAAAGGTGDTSAFRAAEKFYQLHKDQEIKTRRGRRHGGKLVTRPTDLSAVIDLQAPEPHPAVRMVEVPACEAAPWGRSAPAATTGAGPVPTRRAAHGVEGPHPAAQTPQVAPTQPPPPLRAYILPRHAGLVVFPAAVGPEEQVQLMVASLCMYPEPPARTNHYAAYGPLVGVFAAAHQGLACALHRSGVSAGDGGCDSRPSGGASGGGADAGPPGRCCGSWTHDSGVEAPTGHCSSSSSTSSGSGNTCGLLPVQRSYEQCWGAPGSSIPGPPAAHLLRKLRWACLGPNFNWTQRVYEPEQQYRPLPAELAHLARHFHAAALAALHATAATHAMPDAGGPADVSSAPSAVAGSGLCCAAECAPCTACSSICSAAASFHPDVAIVNYYHEGDTLGGHSDDAERDLHQPIVTVSLGCDAVFLMGGATKDVAPSALLLRSGDVLVLAGPARRAYHGLPRVLTEQPLPATLLAVAEAAAAAAGESDVMLREGGTAGEGSRQRELVARCVRHMQACRINISIRSTC